MQWKWIWTRRHGADLTKDRPSFSQQQSPSYMSAAYDRAVRTDSYNDFVMKIDIFTATVRAHNGNADVPFSLYASGLLDPSQQAVDRTLQAQKDIELPEIMSMAMEFFEISLIACTLCATILQSIDEASHQCGLMEVLLAGLHSGEALGFMQQGLMVESLSEMVKARNPFTGSEGSEMFADVTKRYGDLGVAVEVRREVVGRKVRGFKRWRAGFVVVVLAVVVGATVVAVVMATHLAVTMATVPLVAVAAAAVRSKSMNGRNFRQSECRIEKCSESISTNAAAAGMKTADARLLIEQNMRLRAEGGLGGGADDAERRGSLEGAGTSRVEAESSTELRSTQAEISSSSGGREADTGDAAKLGGGAVQMSRMGGAKVEEAAGGAEVGSSSEAATSGASHIREETVGGSAAERRRQCGCCHCCGLGMLTRQRAKLDALARGNFTVNRMLDTLRCLVTGLQDDVERNKKLVEFGWSHREEAKCVQQVGKQLCRNHSHMIRQLANLHEQVVVSFLIINKARNTVLHEFSPSPRKTSRFW